MSKVPAKSRKRGTMLREKVFGVPSGKISLTARLERFDTVDGEVAVMMGFDVFRRLAGALAMIEIES